MTKVVLVGIMGVSPERLFGSETSDNVRQLMEAGRFGPLVGVEGTAAWAEWLTLACGRRVEARGHLARGEASYDLVRAMVSLGTEQTPIWDWVAESGGDSLLIMPSKECDRPDHAYVISLEPTGLKRGAFDLAVEQEASRSRTRCGTPVEQSIFSEGCTDYAAFRARYAGLRACLEAVSWTFVQLIDNTLERLLRDMPSGNRSDAVRDSYLARFDEEIGKTLETLDDDTVFALISLDSASTATAAFGEPTGAYVIAGPDCPVECGPEELSILDVAPTLLAAAGHAIPATMQGTPHFARACEPETGAMGFDQRELELLRERLSGLGYIG